MFLAQGHNAVTPLRLEPANPRSRDKHSTTEPLIAKEKDPDLVLHPLSRPFERQLMFEILEHLP